jgi:hypothetical protein
MKNPIVWVSLHQNALRCHESLESLMQAKEQRICNGWLFADFGIQNGFMDLLFVKCMINQCYLVLYINGLVYIYIIIYCMNCYITMLVNHDKPKLFVRGS